MDDEGDLDPERLAELGMSDIDGLEGYLTPIIHENWGGGVFASAEKPF